MVQTNLRFAGDKSGKGGKEASNTIIRLCFIPLILKFCKFWFRQFAVSMRSTSNTMIYKEMNDYPQFPIKAVLLGMFDKFTKFESSVKI